MPADMMKIEAELRTAVIDRLIAASLNSGKPAMEATLERWRAITPTKSQPNPAS